MMPVPSHLIECVVPKSSVVDEQALDATVKCTCGSTRFRLMFPGQTHNLRGDVIPCTANIDGKYFFIVRANCVRCHREHVLIDADFHGWNGFVCHDAAQASVARPELVAWQCLGCGGSVHEASVQIQTEGREDFVDQAGDEFDPERWPDAFGWFSMTIRCVACHRETPDWVSYETM